MFTIDNKFYEIRDTVINIGMLKGVAIFYEWLEEQEIGGITPNRMFMSPFNFSEWTESTLSTLDALIPTLQSDWVNYEKREIDSYFIPEKTLEVKRTDKAKEIDRKARTQIYSGYISDALGVDHHYPAKDKDQTNMVASVTDSYNPANAIDWTTPFWCMDSSNVWAYRLHTAAQIQKAGSDGKLAILAALSKNAALQQEISEATTEEELAAITW